MPDSNLLLQIWREDTDEPEVSVEAMIMKSGVLFILNVHDDARGHWKICICQGVGYMSRKRRIDSRFLYVRVTAL